MFKVIVRNFDTIFHSHRLTSAIKQKRFAGHSKWANIKHTKAVKDEQKSRMFMRLSQQMRIAIQEGGSTNPDKNLKLAHIVAQARRICMPAASITSMLANCEKDKSGCQSHIIDIKGRVAEGKGRSLFEHKGVVEVEMTEADTAQALENATNAAIECDAEDVKLLPESNRLQFLCPAAHLQRVAKSLEATGYKVITASEEYVPVICVEVTDDEDIEACSVLFERLEALPEVVKLFDNIV